MPHLPHCDDELRDLVKFCYDMIDQDMLTVPGNQLSWSRGSFSWHYVQVVLYRVEQLTRAIEDIANMAKKNRGRNGSYDASAYVFVKCELNAEDKKDAKDWIAANTAEYGALLHDTVVSEYKFSLSFSSEHDTFTACLVGKEDNPINGKKTLTARHKDWGVAALTVLYKHLVIFKGGVWESDQAEDDDGWA